MRSRIKKIVLSLSVAAAVSGGTVAAAVATAEPASAAAATPGTTCTYIKQGQLQQRPCTFAEWWYLRFYG